MTDQEHQTAATDGFSAATDETSEATLMPRDQVQAGPVEAGSADAMRAAIEPLETAAPGPGLEALQREIADLKKQLADQKDALLRQQAEMDNVRRRGSRELEEAHKYALKNFAQELLPVKDSLEMEQAAAAQPDVDVTTLQEGGALILKLLGNALEKFGVQEINPLGEKFNPEWHEAMLMQPMPNVEPSTVLVVHQKGYQLNGRLLRAARVVISQAG